MTNSQSLIKGLLALMLFSVSLSAQNVRGLDCRKQSKEWLEHYSRLDHYIPTTGDPVITIHCNFIIWQNDNGTNNFQDTPEHRERLRNFFHHPVMGLNFQFYQRYNPPSDPFLDPSQEVHTKNIRFELDSIYFIRDSKMTRSIGIGDKRAYLRKNGYKKLLHQLNINITTSPGPTSGAWGHAEYPSFGYQVPMITTTDNPNQLSYKEIPSEQNRGVPVSIATLDGEEYFRDWSFLIHIAHELGHCLDLKHVYAGRVGYGYEACRTSDPDYMDDVFPRDAAWCKDEFKACDVCLQYSDENVPAKRSPNDGHTNNLMNGRGGRYLSPKQLGKIHRALATKSIGIAATGYSSDPIIIDSNQVWDFPLQVYRPIRIRKGVTLRVKCSLRLPPQGYIKLDKGAKLIIDGGSVMSSDPKDPTNWQAFKFRWIKKKPLPVEVINEGNLHLPIVPLAEEK